MERGGGSARTRRVTSVVLAALGAAMLLLGGTVLYLAGSLFDSDRFADEARSALDDERVRTALAEPAVDQVIANGPDELINARPLIESAVVAVLGSEPFEDAFRDGVARIHRAVFTREGNQAVLNIADAGALIADAIASIAPEVAKKVPVEDVGRRLVAISESDALLAAAQVAEDVKIAGIVLPLAGLVCLAGSVALAPRRRRGVIVAAAAVATAAAVGVIAWLVGRAIVLGQFEDDLVHDAVAATWAVFFDELRAWYLVVGAVAVMTAAAASSARAVEVASPARRLADRLLAVPERAGWRIARALAIAAAGLLAVLQPELALEIAAVIAGAFALLYATGEVLTVVAPPVEADREPDLRARISRRRPLAVGLAAIAAAVVVTVIVLSGGGQEPGKRPPGPVTACNGYAELCDRRLNEVVFPAAHNAMSSARDGFITANQNSGLEAQLKDGVRGLLLDAHYGIKRKSGPILTDLEREAGSSVNSSKVTETVEEQLGAEAAERFDRLQQDFARRGGEGERAVYLCHVVCELGATELTEALAGVRKFLETHPDEVLLVFVEDYVDPADVEAAFTEAELARYAYAHMTGAPLPTLRELIESDRRLVVLPEQGTGKEPWYRNGFELFQETPYTFDSAGELADYSYSCEPNRGGTRPPMLLLNHWVEKLPRSPDMAAKVNAYDFLLRRARRCEKDRERSANLIAVDFYEKGDLFAVARKLNGIARGAEPTVRDLD